jgi:hypothetical protein
VLVLSATHHSHRLRSAASEEGDGYLEPESPESMFKTVVYSRLARHRVGPALSDFKRRRNAHRVHVENDERVVPFACNERGHKTSQ